MGALCVLIFLCVGLGVRGDRVGSEGSEGVLCESARPSVCEAPPHITNWSDRVAVRSPPSPSVSAAAGGRRKEEIARRRSQFWFFDFLIFALSVRLRL